MQALVVEFLIHASQVLHQPDPAASWCIELLKRPGLCPLA